MMLRSATLEGMGRAVAEEGMSGAGPRLCGG
jgi:hypothetical protein